MWLVLGKVALTFFSVLLVVILAIPFGAAITNNQTMPDVVKNVLIPMVFYSIIACVIFIIWFRK